MLKKKRLFDRFNVNGNYNEYTALMLPLNLLWYVIE